jgi:hypothetical protein
MEGLNGEGEEKDFFDRWNYDDEQRKEIKAAILSVAE